jgi:hypothetical protein
MTWVQRSPLACRPTEVTFEVPARRPDEVTFCKRSAPLHSEIAQRGLMPTILKT